MVSWRSLPEKPTVNSSYGGEFYQPFCCCWEFAALSAGLTVPVVILKECPLLPARRAVAGEQPIAYVWLWVYFNRNFHISCRGLFFRHCGFLKSLYLSNRLTSPQFLKTNSLLASFPRVFQNLKTSFFLHAFSGLPGKPMLVPFYSCVISFNSNVSFDFRNIGSGRLFRIIIWLR